MPAFISNTQILNIGGTADVNFGDARWVSPKSVSNDTFGVGGGNLAGYNVDNNFMNINNAVNKSIFDQEIKGNK
ncbi:MAG: spore germination protein [Heyndrickxia sp.]